MSEKLNKYVRKELDNGSSREKVLNTLTSAGWEEGEVVKALNEVLDVDSEPVDTEPEEGERSEKVRLFLLALTIFMMGLMIIGIVVGFMYINPEMLF